MSFFSDLFNGLANLLTGGKSVAIGPVTVTPGQVASLLDSATGSIGALTTAWKAHDWTTVENLTVEDALKIASQPEFNAIEGPAALPIDIASVLLPFLITEGSKHLTMNAAEKSAFPSTQSPDQNTDGGWPTTIGNQK